jgi:hypothetical protein
MIDPKLAKKMIERHRATEPVPDLTDVLMSYWAQMQVTVGPTKEQLACPD